MKKLLGLKDGFTLAEVLITLGIIGVVAAMTIPVLMNNIQENQYKVAYKKAFSVASQAWLQVANDNMLEGRNGWESNVSNDDNFNQFMAKFDIVKTCSYPNFSDCWAANETANAWSNLPFTSSSSEICFLDKSGMVWCNSNTLSYIIVDVNGMQKPNIYGKDRFAIATCVGSDRPDSGGQCVVSGMPNTLKPFRDCNSYSLTRCPAGDTHPCYYTKWLYD